MVLGRLHLFSSSVIHPKTLWLTQQHTEGGDRRSRPQDVFIRMPLYSTASERSNDLTLDGDGNVGINGIPRGKAGVQVVSPAQFETGGKSQTAGLEEIMR